MFVVIEGIDNSGKTTLISALKKHLLNLDNFKSLFNNIYFTSEPYGPDEFKKKFNDLCKPIFSSEYSLDSITESLLFLAIRAEHISTYIQPKLKEINTLVVCDRYYLSTLAYQAYLKKIDCDWLDLNMKFISKKLKIYPDLVFINDVKKENWNKFFEEKKDQAKLNKFDVYSYERLIKAYQWAFNKSKKSGDNIINIPSNLFLNEKVDFIALEIIKKFKQILKN